jgi:regulator of replication initiation timing
MHKKLIFEVFDKAKKEIGSEVLTSLSKHIADVLEEDYRFQINERTLRNNYQDALKSDNNNFKLSRTNADNLAKYLGYDSLRDYSKNQKRPWLKKNIEKIIIGGLVLIASYFGCEANQKKCMIWDNDHYKKISCEKENAKPIDKDLLLNFKRIDPDCKSEFFDEMCDVAIWYGKNMNGTLEYFTSLGLHPISGKSLKPITEYMIIKYVCETYKRCTPV